MNWRIFTDANNSDKAEKVAKSVIEKLNVKCSIQKIEPYHKGGFVCSIITHIQLVSWPELVFTALSLAQQIGRSWVLSGNISDEISAWSNEPSVSGVKNIDLQVKNNA